MKKGPFELGGEDEDKGNFSLFFGVLCFFFLLLLFYLPTKIYEGFFLESKIHMGCQVGARFKLYHLIYIF